MVNGLNPGVSVIGYSTVILHLTLKMTTAQVVEKSVTNNSLSKGYPHPEDHDKPIIWLCVTWMFVRAVG